MVSNELININLFSDFSDEDMLILKSITQIKKYKNDDILFYEGDTSDKMYFIIDGKVDVYKTNKKGKILFLTRFLSLSFIAEVSNYTGIDFPASAKSVGEASILVIEYKTFAKKFIHYPKISSMIIKSLANKILNLEKVISSNLVMDAKQRVAKYFYENEECFSCIKHYEIAQNLNITPITFSRILKTFKDENIMEDNKIIDKEKLVKLFS